MAKSPTKAPVINILQWNSQSIRPKLVSFGALLRQEKIHVAILSETWLEAESSVHLSEYNFHRNDRNDGYGGVTIITHRTLQVQVCPATLNNSGIEIIKIKLLNCSDLEYIVSVYCPSSIRTSQSDWDELFMLCPKRSLIAGDFNAHHLNWSYKTETRGIQLSDSALENGFSYLNNGQHTRIKLVRGILQKSSPDITFASSDIAINFEWQVTQENLGSDHLIIKLTMNYYGNTQLIKRRNYKKADWILYRKCLDGLFCTTNIQPDKIQSEYDKFQDHLMKAADKSIPYTKINNNPESKFKPQPYWNPSLSHVVAQRRLRLKQFRRNPTPENLKNLEDKVNESRRLIGQAKAQSWRNFCSKIDESTSVKEVWQRMRWIKGLKNSTFCAPDDKRNELLTALTPDSASCPAPNFNSRNELLESDLSLQELLHCLKKKDTAPGEDNNSSLIL